MGKYQDFAHSTTTLDITNRRKVLQKEIPKFYTFIRPNQEQFRKMQL
jgi:hypothetical protein